MSYKGEFYIQDRVRYRRGLHIREGYIYGMVTYRTGLLIRGFRYRGGGVVTYISGLPIGEVTYSMGTNPGLTK